MGIYNSGIIFGIRIYNLNDNDVSNTLFEEKYCEQMSHHQMREAYLFYTNLNNKNDIFFKIYTECSSTFNRDVDDFMMWYPLSLDAFLKTFGGL